LATGRSSALSASDALRVCETFRSLAGETTRQGLPAWFIRLTGCNLRCLWCDSGYAWEEGAARWIASLLSEADAQDTDLIVVTGGEPLNQPLAGELIAALAERGKTVLVETNGTRPIDSLDPRAVRIVDVKPPSARAAEPFLLAHLHHLRPVDELKFLVADHPDFDFAVDFIRANRLAGRCPLLLSPVFGRLDPAELAEWVLASRLSLRLQLQLHKILWNPQDRRR